MKTAVPFGPTRPRPARAPRPPPRPRWPTPAASSPRYVALTKPRIAVMVLVTVATGFFLGARGASNPSTFAADPARDRPRRRGRQRLNQLFERSRDGLMRRTAGRPLPDRPGHARSRRASSARRSPSAGLVVLALAANLTAAAVALATLVLYVFVYTPLKPLTTLNTAVGAVPGALPPVIGWAAATGRLGVEAWALFLIVFLWQFPHFLAIAWIYREDYARGGHRMLPSVDPAGAMTGRQAAVVRPGAGPRRAPADGRRPGRRLLLRRGAWRWACSTWRRPSGSGPMSPTCPPGGCCGPRSCTCRRSWRCCS